jgi:hypothetical protein
LVLSAAVASAKIAVTKPDTTASKYDGDVFKDQDRLSVRCRHVPVRHRQITGRNPHDSRRHPQETARAFTIPLTREKVASEVKNLANQASARPEMVTT